MGCRGFGCRNICDFLWSLGLLWPVCSRFVFCFGLVLLSSFFFVCAWSILACWCVDWCFFLFLHFIVYGDIVVNFVMMIKSHTAFSNSIIPLLRSVHFLLILKKPPSLWSIFHLIKYPWKWKDPKITQKFTLKKDFFRLIEWALCVCVCVCVSAADACTDGDGG